jgi:capsular exopolysaccharide synthesis family protein
MDIDFLKQYILVFLRWSWAIALAGLLGGGVAFLITSSQTAYYAATVTVSVTLRTPIQGYNAQTAKEYLTEAYEELVVTHPVIEQVITRLNLSDSAGSLADNISVSANRRTAFIAVRVEHTDPQSAANIANALIEELRDHTRTAFANDSLFSRSDVQVIQFAEPGKNPVRPDKKRNTILAFLMCSMLAVGGIGLREFLSEKVYAQSHIETLLGGTVIVALPRYLRVLARSPLFTLNQPFSPLSEGYWLLQAQVFQNQGHASMRSLVVMSSNPGEGKSTILANLAVAQAALGRRVILVDTNVRQPTLHTLFGCANTCGVTTVLRALQQGTGTAAEPPSGGDIDQQIAACLVATEVEHLRLLPAGPEPSHPSLVFRTQTMARLCEKLTEYADVVLFDSPPILTVGDGLVLAEVCDSMLFVVRASANKVDDLHQARRLLAGFGSNGPVIVLNGVAASLASCQGVSSSPLFGWTLLRDWVKQRKS